MIQPETSIVELCHVVRDIDASINHWIAVMGAGPFYLGEMRMPHEYRGETAEMAIKVAFGFSGGLLIELVEPAPDDRSVFREALDATGEGYHHVMLRLDYDEGYRRLTDAGYLPALKSVTPFGERCALFDTRAANGGFIEVMDLHIAFGGIAQTMSEAHQSWDHKSDPVRPLADLFGQAPVPSPT